MTAKELARVASTSRCCSATAYIAYVGLLLDRRLTAAEKAELLGYKQ